MVGPDMLLFKPTGKEDTGDSTVRFIGPFMGGTYDEENPCALTLAAVGVGY